jgi:hypothetical protein
VAKVSKQVRANAKPDLCGYSDPGGSVIAAKREGGIGEYTMINNVCLGKTRLFDFILSYFFIEG